MQKLIELVTNENPVIIKHLGIYVCKAFELIYPFKLISYSLVLKL